MDDRETAARDGWEGEVLFKRGGGGGGPDLLGGGGGPVRLLDGCGGISCS